MPTAYQINWNPVLDHRHAFLLGAWLDVWITLISFALACALGIAVALFRNSGLRTLSWPAFVYVQLVRGAALDCDGDALLLAVHQVGPACHTGERTCFDAGVLSIAGEVTA